METARRHNRIEHAKRTTALDSAGLMAQGTFVGLVFTGTAEAKLIVILAGKFH
jgi:hypothetical protein